MPVLERLCAGPVPWEPTSTSGSTVPAWTMRNSRQDVLKRRQRHLKVQADALEAEVMALTLAKV
jgi:hypothetical protein